MKIELKNVTYNARLSEETAAFAATVYVDGKKAGEARNDGHGGPTLIRPDALAMAIEAHAKTLPEVECYGMKIQPDADMVVADLLNDFLIARDLKRALGRKTLFLQGGKLYETRKGGRPATAEKVLNDLPFDEALGLYQHATQRAS
jgi:hypothetical protein